MCAVITENRKKGKESQNPQLFFQEGREIKITSPAYLPDNYV